jgi:hypothetical protein
VRPAITLTWIIAAILAVAALTKSPAYIIAQAIPLPMEINPNDNDVSFANISFYLNATDHHYHLKGLVKNILPENTDMIIVSVSFSDRATGSSLHSASDTIDRSSTGGIAPNAILPFDIDTGYNATQTYQFQYMSALIT